MSDRPVVSFQAVRALRYALVPLVAMMLASGIFHWTGFDLTSLSEAVTAYVPSSDDRLAPLRLRESEARMMWSITVLLYLAISLYFLMLALSVLGRSVSGRLRLIYVGVILILIGVGLFSLHSGAQQADPVSAIFSFTFDLRSASGNYGGVQLHTLRSILLVINILAVMVPMVCIVTGCAIITHCETEATNDVRALVLPARHLIQLLNVGSLMMVVGILHMDAWLHWPSALVIDQAVGKSIVAFSSAVSLYWGAAYSLMIVAFYAPLAHWLNRRAEVLIADCDDPKITGDPARWLKDKHLSSSPIDQLPRIITMLAPFLAGPVGVALVGGV